MPRWSRSAKDSDATAESTPKKTATGEKRNDTDFAQWIDSLPSSAPTQPHAATLVHFAPDRSSALDLSQANPSGLTQLLSGRRTRLSTLLLDADAFSRAAPAARNVERKIRELREDRGINSGYLAAGTLEWTERTDEGEESFRAPVLLVPLSVTSHESGNDFDVQLTGSAQLNPALERAIPAIAQANKTSSIAALAYFTARLDPTPAIDRVRNVLLNHEEYVVKSGLSISSFATFKPLGEDAMVRPTHPVISKVFAATSPAAHARPGAKEAGVPSPADHAQASRARVEAVDERDPETENLVVDADSSQQEAIDRIAAGESLIVEGPPGTGLTQTAVNALAALADQGKRVLLVAENSSSLADISARLDTVGLKSLMLPSSAAREAQSLREALVAALRRNESATPVDSGSLYDTLRETRHKLRDHVQSLHNVRARWGASPYQAMQSLARLTSLDPAPATTVRLRRSVLDALATRDSAVAQLERAAELGTFTAEATQSPWHGARLGNRKQADDALALARSLNKGLPPLITSLNAVAEFSQIAPPEGLVAWTNVLELLVSIRASLDKFKPDIFDRPVTDLISATAPNSWRRENSVEMSSMTRSRLRRVAKDYIRPGVHIDDLHNSLVEVGRQRDEWAQIAASQRHPAVPAGLADTNLRFMAVFEDAKNLQELLRGSERGSGLLQMPLDQLQDFVRQLSDSKESLSKLPEQTLIVEQLRTLGLDELIEDLGARHVDKSAVRDELELAWWQSALEAMISGDDFLAMSDGPSLRTLEAEYRLADAAHIASGSRRVAQRISTRWKEGIAADKKGANALRDAIRDPELSFQRYLDQSPELIAALTPVIAMSPYEVAQLFDSQERFDALVVLDAAGTDLATLMPAIGRAKQLVLLGDSTSQSTRPFTVVPGSEVSRSAERIPSAIDATATVLPRVRLDHVYRSVDEGFSSWLGDKAYSETLKVLSPARALGSHPRGVSIEYVAEGTGMPSAEQDAVETSAAEVARSVELVVEHIRLRPQNSLAVVSASAKHAAEIERAVRARAESQPDVAAFISRSDEPFVVVSADRSPQLVRDCVIVSVGYARTPHGRALHDFGPLSASGGRQAFVNMVTRSRYLMHILTSILPEHLEPSRLSEGALMLYDLMETLLESPAPRSTDASINDPLVADLMDRMRAHGVIVRHDIDPQIDASAAMAPVPGEDNAVAVRPLAMVSDGTSRYAALSVRERSRLRPQQLEKLGWRYVPLWTIEVFTDPAGLAKQLAKLATPQTPSDPEAVTAATATRNQPAAPQVATESAQVSGSEPAAAESPLVSLNGPGMDPAAEAPGEDSSTDVPSPRPSVPLSRRDARGSEAANKPRHRFNLRSEDSVIPKLAKEDDPESWGERRGADRDQWIRDQKPPHHS